MVTDGQDSTDYGRIAGNLAKELPELLRVMAQT